MASFNINYNLKQFVLSFIERQHISVPSTKQIESEHGSVQSSWLVQYHKFYSKTCDEWTSTGI